MLSSRRQVGLGGRDEPVTLLGEPCQSSEEKS